MLQTSQHQTLNQDEPIGCTDNFTDTNNMSVALHFQQLLQVNNIYFKPCQYASDKLIYYNPIYKMYLQFTQHSIHDCLPPHYIHSCTVL